MDVNEYLNAHEKKDLLRFLTCGSVDDGKSTLIGRLLYDSKLIFEDQLAALRRDSAVNGNAGADEIDCALLLDGLKAEREQGITIDVAYRYFATPRRKFIIADCPGHEQYTRNMATGASTADLAIILIDARHGILTQTRRHAFIVSLLGIRHAVIAVNKIDLVGFSEARFNEIRDAFAEFSKRLAIPHIYPIPISALKGTNVVKTSPEQTPFYKGPSLLEILETVDVAQERNLSDFRFPVQTVIRPDLNFRGFAGTVASGIVRPGDPVRAFPSGKKSRVKSIVTADGNLDVAFPPQAVVLTLEDEIDISSGDLIASDGGPNGAPPQKSARFSANLIWMSQKALVPENEFLLRHGSRFYKATVEKIVRKIDVNTLESSAAETLPLNGLAEVVVRTTQPVFFDAYSKNRATGRFIFVDPISNETAGAGMILSAAESTAGGDDYPSRLEGFWNGSVRPRERSARQYHRPCGILLVGAGTHSLAVALERRLFHDRVNAYALSAPAGGAAANIAPSLPADAKNEHFAARIADLRRTALALVDAGFIFISAIEPAPDVPATADEISRALEPLPVSLVVSLDGACAGASLALASASGDEENVEEILALLIYEGVLPRFSADDYSI